MELTPPLDAHLAQRILDALAPLADAGVSVHALSAKYEGLVSEIRKRLTPEDFQRISIGARRPESPPDWIPVVHAADAVVAILREG